MQRVRIYTTTWCGDCHRAKRFLQEKLVPFQEINIEQVSDAAQFVIRVNNGKRRVPTFEVDGRTFHCSPYNATKLKNELGLE